MADKKVLLTYYSWRRKTKDVAELLGRNIECDEEEINEKNPRKGILGFIRAGRDALKKRGTEIEPFENDISSYDLIIVGTPVWAGHVTCAVRTFLTENKDKINNVAFFCTANSSKEAKEFTDMQEILNKKPKSTMRISTKDFNNLNVYNKILKFLKPLDDYKK